MKRIAAFVCAVSAVLVISGTSLAQEAQDTTEYIFTDENVVGGLIGIEEVNITARPKGKERTLIKVRTHFVPEMLKAVENI